ncbi:MAG: hypothetical protein DMF52_15545 [Acidobacteria bacterium]|nr:MAG: hypothetical protein DMF52_15545 [Acidobacteriota bacterium]
MKSRSEVIALKFAVVLLALASSTLVFRSGDTLPDLPLTEDGYYLLTVVRHIALGDGITIDGHQWTNGFQPLFAFLLVPVYFLCGGDRMTSLRGVLAVHWLMHVATALLVGSIVKAWEGWRLAGFGALLGLLALARIDATIFVVLLVADELFRSERPWRARLWRALVLASTSLLVSSPWWIYNLALSGSLMPSGGTAQLVPFSSERIAPMLMAFMSRGMAYLPTGWVDGAPEGFAYGLLAVAVAWFVTRAVRDTVETGFRVGRMIALATLLLAVYYVWSSGALWFYTRYLAPFMVVAIPATALALARIRRFRIFAQVGVLAPIGAVAVLSILTWHHWRELRQSEPYLEQLRLVEKFVPPGDVVSAGQSGTLGYFRDHVVNLDGKVNAEALRYRGRMLEYLRRHDIRWFCDWNVEFFLGPDPARDGWTRIAGDGLFVLLHRGDPLPARGRDVGGHRRPADRGRSSRGCAPDGIRAGPRPPRRSSRCPHARGRHVAPARGA